MGAKRLLIAVAAIVFSQACYHWTTAKLDPKPGREQVRVTLVGGGQHLVTGPFLSGDSLVWFARTKPDAMGVSLPDTLNRMGVPLTQVYKLQVQRIDPVMTSFALLTTAAVVAGVIAAASWDGLGSGSSGTSSGGGSCDQCYSCPLVYSWDGHNWRLDSGTYGGAITRGLERTDVDNLDYIAAADGIIHLKVRNELNETDYIDALSVIAVDHDADVTVAPDGAGRLYSLGALTHPLAAVDFRGADALEKIRLADGVSWESRFVARDTARPADIRDGLELKFVRPPGISRAKLVLDGRNTPWAASMLSQFIAAHGTATRAWYDSLDASAEMARRTGQALAREGFLGVAVSQGAGWQPQGMFWEAGPEIVKRQVLPLDLSGVSGDTIHIRLESAPSFWLIDQVALDFSPDRALDVTEIQASRAAFGDGRDVRAELSAVDGNVLTTERGDSATLEFQAPPLRAGKARTYLLRSSGWYHIHSPEIGTPAVALLRRMQSEPYAASRYATARLNRLLEAMRADAERAGAQ